MSENHHHFHFLRELHSEQLRLPRTPFFDLPRGKPLHPLTKPTDDLPTFPEPSSPFPESSSGRTKLHRAAFAFTDDLHADSFPSAPPVVEAQHCEHLYLP